MKKQFLILETICTVVALTLCLSACAKNSAENNSAFDIVPVPEKTYTVQHDGKEYVMQTGDIKLSVEKKTEDHYLVSVSGTAAKMDESYVDELYSPDSPITNIICVMMKLPDGATYQDCEMVDKNNKTISITQDDIYTDKSGDWTWLTLGIFNVDGIPTMNSSIIKLT